MNIGDVYSNRKNPSRRGKIVQALAGKVTLELLDDKGDGVDSRQVSEESLSKHWRLEESPLTEVTSDVPPYHGEAEKASDSDAQPPAALEEPVNKPEPLQLVAPTPESPEYEDIRVEIKGKEARFFCKCGDAYIITEGCAYRHLTEKVDAFRQRHEGCLLKKEVQRLLPFGREMAPAVSTVSTDSEADVEESESDEDSDKELEAA